MILFLFNLGILIYIDLEAEKLIAAEKNGQQIAVEVKSFTRDSLVYEFHLALGQCLNYRLGLEEHEPNRILYLAVPIDTYRSFFQRHLPKMAVQHYQLKLLIYSPTKQEIVKWIN